MNIVENIRYNIEKTMVEDGEFYTAVVNYLNSGRGERSAQTVLWELSQSSENGSFFIGLDFADFKLALDNMKIMGRKMYE